MKTSEKIAIAVAVPIVIGGVIYLISKVQAGLQRYLYISAGEGGTTDPPPGTYLKNAGENVTITAIPDEGYTVGTWVVDGVEIGHQEAITITMDSDHTVVVTFWEGGQPPAGAPANIIPMGRIQVWQNVAVSPAQLGYTGKISIKHYKDDWSEEGYSRVPIQFQVVDAGGIGVPNIDVAVFSEKPPDDSRYKGIVVIDGVPHTSENPLIVKTDENGVATAHIGYAYGLKDNFRQLVEDAGVGATAQCLTYPVGFPVYDGVGVCDVCGVVPCFGLVEWHGECYPGKTGCNMPPAYANKIYANVVGTALTTFEVADCSFYIKWV